MKIVVIGGAGFIGSNLVNSLMKEGHNVTVIDNLSGGDKNFIKHHLPSPRFTFVKCDVRNTTQLTRALKPSTDLIYHLAANADISLCVEDPTLDFEHSIVATFSLLQAMRTRKLKKLVYTSGSGVYGDLGRVSSSETFGPLKPVSMYGAAKLGAEGLISAFAHLFGIQAWILRPANIIGPNATHGVVFDFIKLLKKNPTSLRILGDGKQSKTYLYVDDVIKALKTVQKAKESVNIFNLASDTHVTVNTIADLVIQGMGLVNVERRHTGGKIGWPGDVAIVRLNNGAIERLGWKARYTSTEAVKETIKSLLKDPRMINL